MSLEGGVAGEQLIAAITTKGNLHVLPCEFGKQVCRNDRGVCHRLIEILGDGGNKFEQHRRLEHELAMGRPEVARNHPCVPGLVERRVLEADRKAVDVSWRQL